MTSLGAPVTILGAPHITVEQSGKYNLLFWNAAGAPGNHSYYLLFNNFQNSCMQFIFSSVYLFIDIANKSTRGITGLAADGARERFEVRLKITIE